MRRISVLHRHGLDLPGSENRPILADVYVAHVAATAFAQATLHAILQGCVDPVVAEAQLFQYRQGKLDQFFTQLSEQHLPAAINEVFHRSLIAENRFRPNHIEGASRRMEQRTAELKMKQKLARQEEVIEEIETILAGLGLETAEAR